LRFQRGKRTVPLTGPQKNCPEKCSDSNEFTPREKAVKTALKSAAGDLPTPSPLGEGGNALHAESLAPRAGQRRASSDEKLAAY
jgi:hypothetical protein